MQRPGARVARRGHDVSIMSANPHGSPEEIPMRLFSSRKKRRKQTSLTPRRLSSPWRTFKPRLEALEDRCLLSVYLVINTGDNGGVNPAPFAGSGTLRQAIVDADAANTGTAASPDQIAFVIPGAGV